MSCPSNDSSMTSMEGKSHSSQTPPTGLHMDTDHEVSEESEEPVGSEDGVNGQMSPGRVPRQTNILTNASTLRTGSLFW